ncbi:patatin-like phospholipase family protein [Streptomyces coacervatus]|uniref:Patatin-like phospholipase family protein n=1 Tax=Streptomyces coacervatus TaxID=647381 RepID=A0ABP7H766_9ACTN|nr:patatin-like phospholipase family protein [Streptomyces coacervatus]MDF2271547.1 patatin-like phospholipase family protein [Streptomyces coacervatus]
MAGRALVLGGGGVGGIGWLAGMVYGLSEAGVELGDADVVFGTSAGSAVAAQLLALRTPQELPRELYERQLADPEGEIPARLGTGVMARFVWAALTSRTPEAYGRKVGRMALAARTPTEAARRAAIESRLVSPQWPDGPLRIAAVDTATGTLRVFDKDSGVPLADAVAASCAVPGVWPTWPIEGRRWTDGGVYSPANAHLASGYERVVVLAPIASGGGPLASPAAQGGRLAEQGARVAVVTPSEAAKDAIGRNALDPSVRAAAARAGREQAKDHAGEVAQVWGD